MIVSTMDLTEPYAGDHLCCESFDGQMTNSSAGDLKAKFEQHPGAPSFQWPENEEQARLALCYPDWLGEVLGADSRLLDDILVYLQNPPSPVLRSRI